MARLIRRIRADGPHRDVRASVLDRRKTVGAAPSPRKEAPISRRGRRSYGALPPALLWGSVLSGNAFSGLIGHRARLLQVGLQRCGYRRLP